MKVVTMDKTVIEMFENVVLRYQKTLAHFRPCKPGSELLEQNLITLLSHEFLTMFKDDDKCIVYSEIPFKSKAKQQNWSRRLDGFLANSQTAYFVEAKSAKHKANLITDIKGDLGRIFSTELKESFAKMALTAGRSYQIPRDAYGLIIADFWSLKTKAPMFSETEFETSLLPEYSVKAKVEKIGTYGRYDYYLIVAQTNNLNWQ